MKSNNIIVGALVAVIAVMGVAFAAFSTTLTINGTASISSSWLITYEKGTCEVTDSKYVSSSEANQFSRGTVDVDDNGLVTVTTYMVSPGDELTCSITVTNESEGLNAIRSAWKISSEISDTTAYTVNVKANPETAAVLEPDNSETLYVVVKYNDITNEDKPESGENGKATFQAQAVYGQAVTNNQEQ